jgi:hypothetical protein
MAKVTNYPLAEVGDLERLAEDLTKDTLSNFYPSWYTEHWVNFESGSGSRLTFRFERPGYIGTLIASDEEAHYFCSARSKESVNLGTAIAKREPRVKSHNDSSSQPIKEVVEKILGRKKITDISVIMGVNQEADYVKVGVEGGSYGVIAFLPGTLIAVEYSGKEGRKVFGVEGKDIAHRRLDLPMSIYEGKDIVYKDPSTIIGAEIFTIPDFSDLKKEIKHKRLFGKGSKSEKIS